MNLAYIYQLPENRLNLCFLILLSLICIYSCCLYHYSIYYFTAFWLCQVKKFFSQLAYFLLTIKIIESVFVKLFYFIFMLISFRKIFRYGWILLWCKVMNFKRIWFSYFFKTKRFLIFFWPWLVLKFWLSIWILCLINFLRFFVGLNLGDFRNFRWELGWYKIS